MVAMAVSKSKLESGISQSSPKELKGRKKQRKRAVISSTDPSALDHARKRKQGWWRGACWSVFHTPAPLGVLPVAHTLRGPSPPYNVSAQQLWTMEGPLVLVKWYFSRVGGDASTLLVLQGPKEHDHSTLLVVVGHSHIRKWESDLQSCYKACSKWH